MINVTSVLWKDGVKEIEDVSRIVQFGIYWVDFPQPVGRRPGIVVSNDYYISYTLRGGVSKAIDVVPITATIYIENMQYDDDVILFTMRNYTKKHGQIGDTIQCMASIYNKVPIQPSKILTQLGMLSNIKLRDKITHIVQSMYSHEMGISRLERASTYNYVGDTETEFRQINETLYNKEFELVKLYYKALMMDFSDSTFQMSAIASFDRFTPSRMQSSAVIDVAEEILVVAIINNDPISFYRTTELKYKRRLLNVFEYIEENDLMNKWEYNILKHVLIGDIQVEPILYIEKYKSSVVEIKRMLTNMVSTFKLHSKTSIPKYLISELYDYAMELLDWNKQDVIGNFLTDEELSIINIIITLYNFG